MSEPAAPEVNVPTYIAPHLPAYLVATLEPWQLREVICLCKRVASDLVSKERERLRCVLTS